MKLTSEALNLWITAPTLWAVAQWSMISDPALGISGTWITLCTRILTTLVNAGLITCTFRIAAALRRRSGLLVTIYEWIANHIVRAAAHRPVVLGDALCVPRTRIA